MIVDGEARLKDVHFSAQDWARIRRDYSSWWQRKLDRPLVVLGAPGSEPQADAPEFHSSLTNYPPEMSAEEIVKKFVASQAHWRYLGDSFPSFVIIFGPADLAVVLGAELFSTRETVWLKPQLGANLSTLRLEFNRDSYWWKRLKSITETAVAMIGNVFQITFTDLGENLDILASLIGTEALLLALADKPDEVQRALERITEIWLAAYGELYSIIRRKCPGTQAWDNSLWAPGTMYMLQSDFSYMISPEMFKEFVVPDLKACCEHLDYSFYHLDGVGQIRHLDHLLSIEKLNGIQWIPGEGKPKGSEWPDLLRRIRNAGKLAQVYTDCEGARKVCRELGGKGFQFVIGETLTLEESRQFLEEIEGLS